MSVPAPSAVTAQITSNTTRLPPQPTPSSPHHPSHTAHDLHLAQQVAHNLQYQHDWSDLKLYTHGPLTLSHTRSPLLQPQTQPQPPPPPVASPGASPRTAQNIFLLPRPLITGVPPRPVYIHPDTQLALIKRAITDDECSPEETVVLPTRLAEKVSLAALAAVFDALPDVQGIVLPPSTAPGSSAAASASASATGLQHGGGGIAEGRTQGRRRMLRNGDKKRLLLATVDDDSSISYYVVHDGIVKPRQN